MVAVYGAERPEIQKIERAGDENETQVPRRLRTAGALRLRRGRAMVLRRPSARSREDLNDGHRRTSAGEQSRTPGRCAGGAGSGGRGGARPQGERMTILGIDPGAHGAIAVLDEGGELLEVLDMPSTTRGERQDRDQRAPARGDPRSRSCPRRLLRVRRRPTNGREGCGVRLRPRSRRHRGLRRGSRPPDRVPDTADMETARRHSARRREQGPGPHPRNRPVAGPRRSFRPQVRRRPRRGLPDRARRPEAGGAQCLSANASPIAAPPIWSISSTTATLDGDDSDASRTAASPRSFSTGRRNRPIVELAQDGALAASLALQSGCPLDTLRHALNGREAGPLGVALALIDEAPPR